MNKRLSHFLTLLFLLLAATTGSAKIVHLLPKPQQVVAGSGSVVLSGMVSITDPTSTAALSDFFTSQGMTLGAGGLPVTVSLVSEISGAYDYDLAGYDDEAYKLTVTTSAVTIEAITQTGVLRAAQTLTQLAEGYDGTPELEACTITDWPAFKLRGVMHDVGRSFIDIDELKHEIDLLSRYKVNTFHWHLTDNQGFRFESKLYPALNASSSMTRFAGQYYTQEQCTELEAYAKVRGVTVIPEIDMPGHSTAFSTAMGHSMSSTEGRAELVNLIGELASAFPYAPYLHLGFDESNTSADFISEMVAAVQSHGKKAACWDPYGSGSIPTASMGVELLSGWSSRAADVEGIPFIDSRYNYANHFDVFADVVGIYKSTIDKVAQGNANVAGTMSAYWNDRKTATQEDIINQNNFYASVLASAERAWIGGGDAYIEQGGVTLPNSGSEYEAFADWENRFLFHKANSLSAEPIPYVRQTNVHWNITDPFPNGGDKTLTLPPETEGLQDSYTLDGTTYGVNRATGAGIYLRHTWGSYVPSFYSNPQINHTAYAWTYVYSPIAQDVGAQIEFHNYGRSENDTAPDAGCWDRKGSRVWLNDTEILPPTWTNTGVSINSEVDLGNENFSARTPVSVHLNQGWNKVFLKLPYVNANGIRLNKWMFTFVLTDATGRNAVDGLIYSPAQAMDAAADQVAAKITELRAYERSVCGTEVGYYPASAAADMEAVIATIEPTVSQSGYTAEQRAAQITTLDNALTAFQNSLSSASINQPTASTSSATLYYTLMANRDSRYLTSAGAGNNAAGNSTVSDNSYWKFIDRGDGTYDIVNYDGSYLNPSSSIITTSATQPASGWSLLISSVTGYVVIVNDGASHAQVNQANSGQSYRINNWGYGSKVAGEYRLDDTGCQYLIKAHPELGVPFPLVSTAGDVHYYTFKDNRNNRYSTSLGAGNAVVGSTDINDNSYWKFIDRGDDTYDIVNYDGTYLEPNTTTNSAVTTSATQPASGWALGASAVDGLYIIYNDGTGHTQLNQTTSAHSYQVFNWGYGSQTSGEYRLDDTGCQFAIVEHPEITDPASSDPTPGTSDYVQPTVLDSEGRPVAGTKWYTMTIHNDAYRITKQAAGASSITLSATGTANPTGADLWCFVGSDADGFTIYNAAGGVLTYPLTQSGTTGSTSYVIVQDPTTLDTSTYGSTWKLATSTYRTGGSVTPVYLNEDASGNGYGINKRGSALAFWTTGRDAGSTLLIEPTDIMVYYIDDSTGSFSDSNTYHTAWLSTITSPTQVKVSNKRGNIFNTDGKLHFYQTVGQDAYAITSTDSRWEVCGWGGTIKGWSGTGTTERKATSVSGQGFSTFTVGADASKELHVGGLKDNATYAVGTSSYTSNITIDDFYALLQPETSLTPFTPTTISGGDFASNTQWYTLCVGAATMQLRATGDANVTAVEEVMSLSTSDNALWCFVGNEAEGFNIYNKSLGTSYVLTGAVSAAEGDLPAFTAVSGLDESVDNAHWMFHNGSVSSTYYAKLAGQTLKLRNTDRAGQLKLSATQDILCNLYIKEGESTDLQYVVSKVGNGTFTRSNGATASYNVWAKKWTSAQTPTVLLENTANVGNMDLLGDDNLRLDNATGSNGTFRITAPDGYLVKSYVIDFTNAASGSNPATSLRSEETGGPNVVVAAGESAQLLVENINKQQTMFTVVSSGRSCVTATNFTITICRAPEAGTEALYIFPNHVHGGTTEDGTVYATVPYRIPALAKLRDGSLLAAADFRYCKKDIGYGPIDIHGRKRDASGNWGSIFTIADGDVTLGASAYNYAFGDPAIVADRESDNVLMMSCGGKVVFTSSTADNPQHPVRFLSTDGGATWTAGTDMTTEVFNLFNGTPATGTCNAVFFTSGRIMQSRYVKTGSYYRVYSALPVRGTAGSGVAVVYSDDFGATWQRLGSNDVYPGSTCDEAKVEEMPDGRVILSTRVSGSRKFNVFTYTNSANAEGYWGQEAAYASGTNACNGEHLMVPAKRVSDNAQVFVLLMSLPQSGSRENVGFYYKEIDGFDDYADGTALAGGWTKSLQVSQTTSCYSTMQLLDDGTIAFLYEENLLDGGYDIVFREFTLSGLTSGLYTFDDSYTETAAQRLPYLQSTADGLPASLTSDYVGGRPAARIAADAGVTSALSAFTSAPTQSTLEAYIAALRNVEPVTLLAGKPYRLYNKLYPARVLGSNGSTLTSVVADATALDQLFIFESAGDGTWYIHNAINRDYAAATGNTGAAVPTSADAPVAYQIVSNEKGETYFKCTSPTNASYPAIHNNSSDVIVPWSTAYTSNASYWLVEPVDSWDWTFGTATGLSESYATAYLPFDLQLPDGVKAYTASMDAAFKVATAVEIPGNTVPAGTPVILCDNNAATSVSLTIPDVVSTDTYENDLTGSYVVVSDYDAANTFVLSLGPDGSTVGFYRFGGTALAACRAYLLRPSSSGSSDVRAIALVFGNKTGVASPVTAPATSVAYDLQGRRVARPASGIYIIDGKKTIMK